MFLKSISWEQMNHLQKNNFVMVSKMALYKMNINCADQKLQMAIIARLSWQCPQNHKTLWENEYKMGFFHRNYFIDQLSMMAASTGQRLTSIYLIMIIFIYRVLWEIKLNLIYMYISEITKSGKVEWLEWSSKLKMYICLCGWWYSTKHTFSMLFRN
jgi:hypothetical protein